MQCVRSKYFGRPQGGYILQTSLKCMHGVIYILTAGAVIDIREKWTNAVFNSELILSVAQFKGVSDC